MTRIGSSVYFRSCFFFILKVILNIWNISHGPHIFPKRQKILLEDAKLDKELQTQIECMFGKHIRDYILGLAKNEYNLQYLPTKVFLRITKYLATNDILRLSQTSKIFFEASILCFKQRFSFNTKQC